MGFTSAGAKARQGSLHDSHAAAAELLSGLDDLMSNHSNVVEARDTAKSAFDTAVQNHAQMKNQIDELKVSNDKYQRQMEVMEKEKSSLKANYTAVGEAEMLVDRCVHAQTPTLTFLSFCQWKAVAVPPVGSILCPLAIYFLLLRAATSKKIGMTAERTASDEKPTWSSSTAQRSRWVDAKRVRTTARHSLQASIFYFLNLPQTFVSHNIETLIRGRPFWDSSFWLGIRDTEIEGTWVWINNVTEVEQRWENPCRTTSERHGWLKLYFHYKGSGGMESPMTVDTMEKTAGLHITVNNTPGRHVMMPIVEELNCSGYVKKL